MNGVNLIGRWTRDVELRYTQSGKPVASCTLAVNDGGDQATFVPVVIWDKQAEAVTNNCGTKGRQVGVAGRLQSRTYQTQDGQKRTVLEVVASRVDFLGDGRSSGGQAQVVGGRATAPAFDDDDDLPFE